MRTKNLLFVFLFLIAARLPAQSTWLAGFRFISETKKLGNLVGKASDPFPVIGNGIGFMTGYEFPAAAGMLELKTGVIEFFAHDLQLSSGTWRYQSAMFPAEVQYYSPPFINTNHFHFGLRGTGGIYFTSTLAKAPGTFAAEKSKQTLGGWDIGIFSSYRFRGKNGPFSPLFLMDFCRIGKYNFSSAELLIPFSFR